MSEPPERVSAPAEVNHLTVRQAAFIGVGSMVGAGIFALLGAAIAAAAVILVTFVFTTLIHEPASIVALLVILGLSVALDYWWKRSRTSRAGPVQVAPNPQEQG